jgi:hypothetical protein
MGDPNYSAAANNNNNSNNNSGRGGLGKDVAEGAALVGAGGLAAREYEKHQNQHPQNMMTGPGGAMAPSGLQTLPSGGGNALQSQLQEGSPMTNLAATTGVPPEVLMQNLSMANQEGQQLDPMAANRWLDSAPTGIQRDVGNLAAGTGLSSAAIFAALQRSQGNSMGPGGGMGGMTGGAQAPLYYAVGPAGEDGNPRITPPPGTTLYAVVPQTVVPQFVPVGGQGGNSAAGTNIGAGMGQQGQQIPAAPMYAQGNQNMQGNQTMQREGQWRDASILPN